MPTGSAGVLRVGRVAPAAASYAGRQASATEASCALSWTSRGRHASKPVERATASYQCGAQTPSRLPQPGRPAQHPVGEVDAEPVAQPAQVGLGVAEEVAGVDHRRVLGERIEQPNLLEQPDVVGLAGLARADVGGDDLGGVADQQHVAEPVDPVQVGMSSSRWWVICLA